MAEIRDLCTDCDRPMVSQPIYNRQPQRWRLQGFVRHGGSGLCNGCYCRARRSGNGPRPARPPKVAIETTYTLRCETCGDLGNPASRAEAEAARDKHLATHRKPARPLLDDGELARLRADVGLVGVA